MLLPSVKTFFDQDRPRRDFIAEMRVLLDKMQDEAAEIDDHDMARCRVYAINLVSQMQQRIEEQKVTQKEQ
jgi:hypothetical protein